MTFLSFGTVLCASALLLKTLLQLLSTAVRRPTRAKPLDKVALLVGALVLPLILLEGALQAAGAAASPLPKETRPTIPEEWKLRPAPGDGASGVQRFYWHDRVHVFNQDRMRFEGDFAARTSGVFRIMVVGGSLTYGYGIAVEDTYCSVLEREPNKTHRAEVLNLGVCGLQSRRICKVVKEHLPRLEPDLVVYGVCINDFLPDYTRQYQSRPNAFELPLPCKEVFLSRTLTGEFLSKRYDELLMWLQLRPDFLTDILADFQGTQQRFSRDVREMNTLVQGRGLPPVMAMVLMQNMDTDGKEYRIARVAEGHLSSAGMNVVPSTYVRQHDGEHLKVSPWEGHPNAEANAIFAEQLLSNVLEVPALAAYRRDE